MARRIKDSLVFDVGDTVRVSLDVSAYDNRTSFLVSLRGLNHALKVDKVFEDNGVYLYYCIDTVTGKMVHYVNENIEIVPFPFTSDDLGMVVVPHPNPTIPRVGDIINVIKGYDNNYGPLENKDLKVLKIKLNPNAVLDSKKYEITCCLAHDNNAIILDKIYPDNIVIMSTPQESLQPTAGELAIIKYDMKSYLENGFFYYNRMKIFVGKDVFISEASIMSGELVYKCIDAHTSLPILRRGLSTEKIEYEFYASELSLCNYRFKKDRVIKALDLLFGGVDLAKSKDFFAQAIISNPNFFNTALNTKESEEINQEQQKLKDENNDTSEMVDEMSELISSIADVFDTPPIIIKLSKTESGELNFEEINISKDNSLNDEVECNCPRGVSKKENRKTTKKEVKDNSKLAELLLGKSEIKNIVEKLDKHINLYDLSSIFNEERLVKEVYVRTPSTTKTQMLEVKIAVYKTEDILEDLRVLNVYAEDRFKEAKQPYDSTLIQRNVRIANKILAKMVEDNKEYNPNLEYEIGGIDFTSPNLSAGTKLDLNDSYFGIVIATDNL